MQLPPTQARLMVPAAIFLTPAIVALLFAEYTNFIWEDWLIAYRSSVNLVLGHGLVYDGSARVQSFTSPLGVLVPSAIAWLSGTVAPQGVIWPFRVFQAGLLGLTALALDAVLRSRGAGPWPRVLAFGLFVLNTKTISSTMGGMETGFSLFFIAGALYALFVSRRSSRLLLGLGAAGLMWTRPDGFVYLLAVCFGAFVFPAALSNPRDRRTLLWDYAVAAGIAAALYLPWLIGAQLYFGSFVPLTAQAKGLSFHLLDRLDARALLFPFTSLLRGGWTNFDQTFSPRTSRQVFSMAAGRRW